jgi:hypothetical protein
VYADTIKNGYHFAFFRFADSTTLTAADSASTKWDIGFCRTFIILNSGKRGPGNVSVTILSDTSFPELLQAPLTGYATEPADVMDSTYAIPAVTDKGWYHYDYATHLITPIAGKVFVFKLNDGKYVKMRITNYYLGHPETPDPMVNSSKYYSFEYQISESTDGKFK